LLSRRSLLTWLGRAALSGLSLVTYASAVEAGLRLRVVTHSFTPPRWTAGLKLKIVMLSDPHIISPHMSLERWRGIVERANAMQPDLILFMGDLLATHRFCTKHHTFEEAATIAAHARARLGTYAIIGNHDWWVDHAAQKSKHGPIRAQAALEAAGIPVLVNKAVRLENSGSPFWIAGTDSIVAIKTADPDTFIGRDDLPGTLSQVTDDAPIIHLAHEPDLFVDVPDRVSVTLSGHTHGGQIRLLGYAPVSNSKYGQRYIHGHIIEDNRHLIVSGGLGCSVLPIRLGSPPEITVLELG
jgi:predicted MPP superfamily phosphohydrolase